MRSPYERMRRQMNRCDEYIKECDDQMKRYNEQGDGRMEGWEDERIK
jgi:hypothetical protein